MRGRPPPAWGLSCGSSSLRRDHRRARHTSCPRDRRGTIHGHRGARETSTPSHASQYFAAQEAQLTQTFLHLLTADAEGARRLLDVDGALETFDRLLEHSDGHQKLGREEVGFVLELVLLPLHLTRCRLVAVQDVMSDLVRQSPPFACRRRAFLRLQTRA